VLWFVWLLQYAVDKCEYWRLADGANKPPGLIGWWPSKSVVSDRVSQPCMWVPTGGIIHLGGTACIWGQPSVMQQGESLLRDRWDCRSAAHCFAKLASLQQ